MNLPNYNPEGKKLTFAQHREKKRKLEELETQKLEMNNGEVPGRCSECNGAKFSLKCGPGVSIITRTCRNCGNEKQY
jgi:hypothetical protein